MSSGTHDPVTGADYDPMQRTAIHGDRDLHARTAGALD